MSEHSHDSKLNRASLPAGLADRLVLPDEEGWDAARLAWNLAVDQRPAAVAFPESAGEVAQLVAFAADRGLRVAAQGTGHGAAAMGPLTDTLLLKTERMRRVEIDPDRRVARVQAGAVWADVTTPAAEHGLAALAGSAADVGVVGYCLGGGLSWLARRHGLAANDIVSFDAVLADGSAMHVDTDSEPDLFWALRGGGGSFAVITTLELALHPLSEVYAGTLFWPLERAGEALEAWRAWCEDLPVEAMSCGRMLQLPPIPDVPEPFRGRSFTAVETVFLTGEDEARQLLAPLLALSPEIDAFATISPSALSSLHMDPEHPVPFAGDGMLLSELSPEAIEALVAVAGAGSRSPLLSVELRHCEGALDHAAPGCGALGSLAGDFALYAVGIVMDEAMGQAVREHLERVTNAMGPWAAPSSYANFLETHGDSARLFAPDVHARLCAIKATYDPGNVIRGNHAIMPAG